jgi:hypothetical protein
MQVQYPEHSNASLTEFRKQVLFLVTDHIVDDMLRPKRQKLYGDQYVDLEIYFFI